jgi:hypothetical protein
MRPRERTTGTWATDEDRPQPARTQPIDATSFVVESPSGAEADLPLRFRVLLYLGAEVYVLGFVACTSTGQGTAQVHLLCHDATVLLVCNHPGSVIVA